MRISTNQIFQTSLFGVLRQQERVLKIQQQLSSGRKLSSPSDNPIDASQINLFNEALTSTKSMQKNRIAAITSVTIEENALDNSVRVLQRVRELQIEAAKDSLSQEDRAAIAVEAQNLLNQLQDLANTQDNNHDYIFSGGQTSTQPFTINSSGLYVYNGDDTQRFIEVSANLQIALNDSGADIFMSITNGNGSFTVSQPTTANTGSVAATTGAVVDGAAYVADNYTIQFVLNTQNQMVVMVSGVASGSVIPPSGNPDDAPLYQNGGAIDFNGIEITFNGTPEPGDSLLINPAQNESIFATIAQMIDNLNSSVGTASDKAVVQTENNQILAQIDSALNNILYYEAQSGTRLNQLDIADNINSDIILLNKTMRSMIRDADLAEAAVKLNLQQVYLELAQQSFARIQGLTIFNYI